MTYSLEVSNSEGLREYELVYSLSLEGSHWFLAGKTGGRLNFQDSSKLSIEAVAVPTLSGFLDTFPKMNVAMVQSKNREQIPVQMRCPDSFLSLPTTEEVTAIAYRVRK